MAAPNIAELTALTIKNYSGMLADNVSDNNALLRKIAKGRTLVPWSGGETILQELEYAENSTYMRYSGYQTLNISPSEVFTAAEFNPKQVSVAVTVSGLEKLKNSGKERIHNLVKSRVKNAGRTFKNNHSTDIYSDGTADGGKQIGGLQLLVADDPTTGVVGGIDRSAWSFWQNQLYDFSVDHTSGAASATSITDGMNQLWMRCARGTDTTDLIIFDDVYYGYYWDSLIDIQRITTDSDASAGFSTIKYKGNVPVVLDGGQGGACPASHGYFLNTEYLHYRPHSEYVKGPQPSEDRFATNQDAVVKLILWAGNMTVSNSALQGVMHA